MHNVSLYFTLDYDISLFWVLSPLVGLLPFSCLREQAFFSARNLWPNGHMTKASHQSTKRKTPPPARRPRPPNHPSCCTTVPQDDRRRLGGQPGRELPRQLPAHDAAAASPQAVTRRQGVLRQLQPPQEGGRSGRPYPGRAVARQTEGVCFFFISRRFGVSGTQRRASGALPPCWHMRWGGAGSDSCSGVRQLV